MQTSLPFALTGNAAVSVSARTGLTNLSTSVTSRPHPPNKGERGGVGGGCWGWGGVGKNHHSRMYAGLANLSEDGGEGERGEGGGENYRSKM